MSLKLARVYVKPSNHVHAILEVSVALEPYLLTCLRMDAPREVEGVTCPAHVDRLNPSDDLAVEPDRPTRQLMTL